VEGRDRATARRSARERGQAGVSATRGTTCPSRHAIKLRLGASEPPKPKGHTTNDGDGTLARPVPYAGGSTPREPPAYSGSGIN
jgi:hypothetical protein